MGIQNLLGTGEIKSGSNTKLRKSKARRMVILLGRFRSLENVTVLDLGAGTGLIAAELQRLLNANSEVTAADICDRMIDKSFPYLEVVDNQVPLPDHSQDIVISNHVVEHVGDESAQRDYLSECRRVLRPNGILYLAIPNRWTIFEPHYKTPFLSWPPEKYRDRFLEFLDRRKLVRYKPNLPEYKQGYPLRPMSRRQTAEMLKDTGFIAKDVTGLSLQLVLVEDLGMAKLPALLVAPILNLIFRFIIPTIIFIAYPDASD